MNKRAKVCNVKEKENVRNVDAMETNKTNFVSNSFKEMAFFEI